MKRRDAKIRFYLIELLFVTIFSPSVYYEGS